MGTPSPLDRSAAHAALLEYVPAFGKTDLDGTSAMISAFLADFYASPSKNMGDFAKRWSPDRPQPLAVQRRRAETRSALASILGPSVPVTEEMVTAFILEADIEHELESRVS